MPLLLNAPLKIHKFNKHPGRLIEALRYVENDVMTTVIKRCRGEKDEAKEKQMDSEKS